MQSKEVVCWVLYRVLLPLVQLGATVVRINGFSLLYGCLLLVGPLLPAPSVISMKGRTGGFLVTELVLCSLTLLAQIIFQSYLLIVATDEDPYGTILTNCSTVEATLRQVGLQRLEPNDFGHIVRVILPDILMFIFALIVFIACYKLLRPPTAPSQPIEPQQAEEQQPLTEPPASPLRRDSSSNAVVSFIGEFLVAVFLCASGVAYPCVISAIYFVCFLGLAVWWACYRRLGPMFCIIRVMLLVLSGLHLVLLYLYQFQFFQEALGHTEFTARLVGLTGIVETDCNHKPWMLEFWDDLTWPMLLSPAMILILYFVLAWEIRRQPTKVEVRVRNGKEQLEKAKKSKRSSSQSSERQVLGAPDTNESLMEQEHPSYQSIEPADTDSIVPQPDIYGSTHEAEPLDDELDGSSSQERSKIVSLLVFLMQQSYIYTLIVMMAWSITYHSWLTFVMLLAACIIWVIPQKRAVCLYLSPVIVCYAIGLLTIQYVYGLDIDLPDHTPSGYSYSQIGLKKYDYPCAPLALQVLFTSVFLVTLRQFMREMVARRQEEAMQGLALVQVDNGEPTTAHSHPHRTTDFVDGYDSATVKAMGHWLWHLMCKYWIFVCAAMFLVMAILEAVIYRIVYMVLFLYFVSAFQLFYRWWRLTIAAFWWLVIVYSMIVLILIYTYQFDEFPGYWERTGLSSDAIKDLGLETFNTATLFLKLLTPTSFLIVIILQLHYFHHPFLRISDIHRFRVADSDAADGPNGSNAENPTIEDSSAPLQPADSHPESPSEDVVDHGHDPNKDTGLCATLKRGIKRVWTVGYHLLDIFCVFLWRVLEIHMVKVAMFTIFIVCLEEISAVSVVLVLFVVLAIPLPSLHRLMSHLSLLWAGLIILAKMIYQLRLVSGDNFLVNCTSVSNEEVVNGSLPYPWDETIDSAHYVGLEKTDNLAKYLGNFIAIVLILALESIVYLHQSQYYNKPEAQRSQPGIIFTNTKRPDADKGLIECAKYLANYTFYKFGLEICFIMTVVTIAVRLDMYAVLYGIFVICLLFLDRHKCFILWPGYMVVLLVLLAVQYLSCLGVPPGICWGYPWDDKMTANLKIYLYLPNYVDPPDPYKLIADFFQVLFVCLQWRVFRIEVSTQRSEKYGGGSNKCIVEEVENNGPNPTEDFIVCQDSYLDYIKSGVFRYMFWVTLIIIFIAGTARISLFCMGYLVGCFFFFWYGQELLVKPLRNLLRLWRILIAYNFFVIICKACLQLVGCVYMTTLADKYCWLVQLFSILCQRAGNYVTEADDDGAAKCNMAEDEAGLTWDAICFVFLLLQLRIYKSHYFRHQVMDLEVQMKLSSRGAELINTTLIKQVEMQKQHEVDVLDAIKRKMERIRLRQERLHVKKPLDADDHYTVIRSGDYFMFEDDSDDDDESEDTLAELEKQRDGLPGEDDETVGPLELINTALKGGTKEALSVAEGGRKSQVSESEGDSTPQSPGAGPSGGEAPLTPVAEEDETDGKKKEEKEPLGTRILNSLKLAWAVFCGAIDYLIRVLQTISREYRSVSKVLDEEKEEEKRRIRAELALKNEQKTEPADDEEGAAAADTADTKALTPKRTVGPKDVQIAVEESARQREFEESLDEMRDAEKEFKSSMPRILQLLVALFEALMSHSELVCYFAMILNHLVSASLLSLLYPISVFLWAMLSVPRPPKTYWITVITYTEAVVVVKYLFQFGFFPWNDDTVHEDPFWPPRIIGIERKGNYAAFDLFLLFCLFIHRSVLKAHGLWKDAEDIDADMKKAEQQVASNVNTPAASPTQPTPAAIMFSESGEDTAGSQKGGPQEEETKRSVLATVFGPFGKFYRNMINPQYNAVTDVYAPMFLCDFIVFLITVFGYWAFGPVEGAGAAEAVSAVLQENKVPLPFLIMLLIQFILIIIDRALYLRKNILGKFVFQIFLVILVHAWLFFILPAITHRRFTDNLPAQLWFFTKCIYFALSAYQIRSGYPTRILGNFLTKRYNHASLFLFKGFLAIPFLLELRAVMDWMWTDTTLALTSWLQMEDIYANIFCLKCWRTIEHKYPTPRGQKRKAPAKYGVGGLLLFILIFIIWFPLLLFSLASAVFMANPPMDCSVEIRIGGYEPIYEMSAQQQFLQKFSDKQYKQFQDKFATSGGAVSFLNGYQAEDVYAIRLNSISASTWAISPPSKVALQDDLKGNNNINLYFTVTFTREPSETNAETVSNVFITPLQNRTIRTMLADMIYNGTDSVTLNEVFPPFILVPSNEKPVEIPVLMNAHNLTFSGVKAEVEHEEDMSWWKMNEIQKDETKGLPPPPPGSKYLTLIAFNERVAPGALSFLTSYGVIGLYLSVILVVGKFVRVATTGMAVTIWFTALPDVTRIYDLCMDIYMVRETNSFELEEELFAKLTFLYRSTETMIAYTRPRREKPKQD